MFTSDGQVKKVRAIVLLCGLLIVAGCNSGGGGTSPPAVTSQTIVSGAVQAPGGQVAFYRQQGPLERFADLFTSSAYAAVSGLSSVLDGTQVELGRINEAGVVTRLATTTTSGGRYSFNLTSLGLSFSSDLVVRVVNTSTGAQMRAFVTGETVNLDPVAETAVRMILEQIALYPGTVLSQFTPQELLDLVGGIDLLTTTNQAAAGLTLETTVTAIKQSATANAGLMAFLAAAAGAGETTEGPGDIGNYYFLTQGNVWRFQGTKSENGLPPVNFVNTAMVTGTKAVGGVTATVLTKTNPDGLGQEIEDYLIKDSRGITNHGNNDATDPLTPQLIPYRELRFPLQQGATFEALNKKGVNFGDLDGDFQNETGDVLAQVTVAAFESVTVPAGMFANSAKIEAKITSTVTLSSNGTKVTVTETQTDWLAPGVGPVKRQSQTSGQGFSETVLEELAGYLVNGQGKGTVSLTIATSIATADSNESNPGKSGLASNGANYLLVSCRELGSSPGIFGVFVSGGIAGEPFPIVSGDCRSLGGTSENSISLPNVAFDGTNYLVVFVKGAIIRGTRVSQSGVVLDGPSGFAISTGQLFIISNWSPAVAFNGTNYLVVWNKYNGLDHDIYGARVTPGGQAQGEFPISIASGTQDSPNLAFDGVNYLVVWNDSRNGNQDIFGARVTPSGTVLDPSGIPIATTPLFEDGPHLSFDGTNYLVVWRSSLSMVFLPPPAEIRGTRIRPVGTLLDGSSSGGGIGINTIVLGKSEPAVAFDGTNFLVTWVAGAYSNNPPVGMFGAKVSPGGQVVEGLPTTTGISLSEPPPPFTRFHFPVISSNGANVLLTWVNNIELAGQTKSIVGTLIFP